MLFKHCLSYFLETRSLHSRLARLEEEAEEEEEEEDQEGSAAVSHSSTLKLSQELNDAQRKIIVLQDQVIKLKDAIRTAETSAVTKAV